MKISVCICTYKRPELLDRLLNKLSIVSTDGKFNFNVIVADNDDKQSGFPIVSRFKKNRKINISYFAEPRKGISYARNCCVKNADGDYIAFIDDDEFPITEWLIHLANAAHVFNADAVFGPVRPHFDSAAPAWLLKSRLCEREEHPTGSIVPPNERRTGNVLIRKDILNFEPVFRHEFAAGSEDTDLFNRLGKNGCLFIWCNEAITYEVVTPNRWKRSYYLRRALLRGGSSLKRTDKKIVSVAKSAVALPAYALLLLILLFYKRYLFMKYAVKLCDHIGKLFALVGIKFVTEKKG
jgi:succinoglycan biosynthesis protein ExoM